MILLHQALWCNTPAPQLHLLLIPPHPDDQITYLQSCVTTTGWYEYRNDRQALSAASLSAALRCREQRVCLVLFPSRQEMTGYNGNGSRKTPKSKVSVSSQLVDHLPWLSMCGFEFLMQRLSGSIHCGKWMSTVYFHWNLEGGKEGLH